VCGGRLLGEIKVLYKLLGVVSLVIGAVFGVIALFVLLPFLSNFNLSLLVLLLIFSVFAWVFLAVGWQLLHPPTGKKKSAGASLTAEAEPSTTVEPSMKAESSLVDREQTLMAERRVPPPEPPTDSEAAEPAPAGDGHHFAGFAEPQHPLPDSRPVTVRRRARDRAPEGNGSGELH